MHWFTFVQKYNTVTIQSNHALLIFDNNVSVHSKPEDQPNWIIYEVFICATSCVHRE